MSDETGQCLLLMKLLWLDDEDAPGSTKDCYECHTNTNQYYSCGKKIQKKRQKGLEVQFLTPPHANYRMLCVPKPLCGVCGQSHEMMDFETPCRLKVTGKKIYLKPPPCPVRRTSAMKYNLKTYTSNCANKLVSSAIDDCVKNLRPVSCRNYRRVRSARDEHLMELLNEFSVIRSRSQKAKEQLEEKFRDRKLRLNKQAFNCSENSDDVTKAKFMEDTSDWCSDTKSPNDSLLNCDCY